MTTTATIEYDYPVKHHAKPCQEAPACRKKIIHARDSVKGHFVPVDVSTPVYEITVNPNGPGFVARRLTWAGVIHFATCTNPERFSKRKAPKG